MGLSVYKEEAATATATTFFFLFSKVGTNQMFKIPLGLGLGVAYRIDRDLLTDMDKQQVEGKAMQRRETHLVTCQVD